MIELILIGTAILVVYLGIGLLLAAALRKDLAEPLEMVLFWPVIILVVGMAIITIEIPEKIRNIILKRRK